MRSTLPGYARRARSAEEEAVAQEHDLPLDEYHRAGLEITNVSMPPGVAPAGERERRYFTVWYRR
jgi:hypothetical protein